MATRLDLSYDRAVSNVRKQMLGYAKRYWNGLGSWRDADYERLVAKLVPRVEAGQQRVADLTAAYIGRLAVAEFGTSSDAPVLRATTAALRGVDAETVYYRPFVSMRTELSKGANVSSAIGAGATRLESLITSGQQLAKTHSARDSMGRTKFKLYQRVLTGREDCALCVIASTQRYHHGALLPIHPGCDCGVRPFSGDPRIQVIDPALLESTHFEIAVKLGSSERSARDLNLAKVASSGKPISDYTELIISREHGELGPVLAWRTDHFTGSVDPTNHMF